MFDTDASLEEGPESPATWRYDPDAARVREAELRREVAHLNAQTARVIELVGQIDADESWGEHQGCLSVTHLLSWRCGVGGRDAGRWVASARKLREPPVTAEAFGAGRLSLTQVEAIGRVATPATDASHVQWATQRTAAQLDILTRAHRRAARLQDQQDQARHRRRHLYTRFDDDGVYQISGLLAPETGALVDKALDAAQDELFKASQDDDRSDDPYGARRADALVALAESALASEGRRSGADAYQVVLHVTPDALVPRSDPTEESRCEVEPGVGLASATAQMICCHASFVTLLEDKDGNVLDVGRKTRNISPALRRALRARDRDRCRHPGCTQRRFKDAHHIRFWTEGGETKLANLLSLCRRHHRMVHQGLIRIELAPDGSFVFYDRWGRVIPDHGEPLELTGLPLAERHTGLGIDAETCRPEWYGDPLDTYATDVIVEHHQALEERARCELEHRARAPSFDARDGDPPERPPGPFEPPQRPPP
ncbi:MAG: DUF222 domain-containing protein [Actinomycetota bacterium]